MLTTTFLTFAGILMPAFVLVPVFAEAAWVGGDWSRRMPFSARPDQVDVVAAHVGFPMLVSLDGANHPGVFAQAKPDGSDLVITKGDGTTILPREIVSFDPDGQTAEIWVKVDALSDVENQFYLYYGNPDTTIVSSPSDAWNDDYIAVYHFADDPGGGVLTDSSPVARNVPVDAAWTSADTTSGQIHQAWLFNGVDHFLQARGISTQDSSYTMSGWLLHTSDGTDFFMQALPVFWHTSSQTTNTSPQADYVGDPGNVRWEPNPILRDGQYHHFAWVFDGVNDTVTFHYDGEPQQPGLVISPGTTFYTGYPINPDGIYPVGVYGPMYFNNGDLMDGGGDEFHLREGASSEEWVRTEYRNQRDPVGFFEFGSEEVQGVTAVEAVDRSVAFLAPNFPNPFRGATSIRFHLPAPGHTRLAVYDMAGRQVAHLIDAVLPAGKHESGWNGRTLRGQEAAAGVYFLRLETPSGSSSIKMLLQP
jgi:hypothetical protein